MMRHTTCKDSEKDILLTTDSDAVGAGQNAELNEGKQMSSGSV